MARFISSSSPLHSELWTHAGGLCTPSSSLGGEGIDILGSTGEYKLGGSRGMEGGRVDHDDASSKITNS